ncbi:uncharacterized protein N7479_003329 [Penicillium vulpinum]|uniref:uncharacterized protein n=1 Tax=Penicillium vulpinum TaxID=29845 RepID=UPI002547EFA0|nr:uncharacterized protein N7479_003329 [Penicillium vulpinum]KAJ5963453.1 hypothetical protein N7479_003329 [Penicillium vulpinum]
MQEMKSSSPPGIPSSLDDSKPNVDPKVQPATPARKLKTKNPTQVAQRTPLNASEVLVSTKRALPWVETPTKEFLLRDSRNEKQMRVNINEPGMLWLANLAFSMNIISHDIGGTKDVPEISFDVVGSTGSIYKTVIGKVPRCECPDYRFRKAQFLSAMDVPGKLRYQRSFLPSVSIASPNQASLCLYIYLTQLHFIKELREMIASSSLDRIVETSGIISTGRSKPIEGECPICFNDFNSNQETMCCQVCDNHVHEACFKNWKATALGAKDVVRCLFCYPHIAKPHGKAMNETLISPERPSEAGALAQRIGQRARQIFLDDVANLKMWSLVLGWGGLIMLDTPK